MIRVEVPLQLKKGDYFEMPIRVSEQNADGSFKDWLDLTNWTPNAQIRQTPGGSVMVQMSIHKEDQLLLPGSFWVWYSKTDAASLTVTTAVPWQWEVDITESGSDGFQTGRRYTIMGGSVTVDDETAHS